MKCRCAVILVFAFVIQLSNAAPPFDIDLFLDELLEMNIRMGDIILRAKHEYKEAKDNELKDTPIYGGVIEDPVDNPTVERNPIIQWNRPESHQLNEPFNFVKPPNETESGEDTENGKYLADDQVEKSERSFIGQTLDVIGNQWNSWFDRKKSTEIEEVNSQGNSIIEAENGGKFGEINGNFNDLSAVVVDADENVLNERHDQPADDQNVNDSVVLERDRFWTLDQPMVDERIINIESNDIEAEVETTNDSEPDNVEPDNVEPDNVEPDNVEPDNVDPDNSEPTNSEPTNSEPTNSEPDNLESDNAVYNHDLEGLPHDEQDWGEETSNNEEEIDNDNGWFGNAIDSIVNFFT